MKEEVEEEHEEYRAETFEEFFARQGDSDSENASNDTDIEGGDEEFDFEQWEITEPSKFDQVV